MRNAQQRLLTDHNRELRTLVLVIEKYPVEMTPPVAFPSPSNNLSRELTFRSCRNAFVNFGRIPLFTYPLKICNSRVSHESQDKAFVKLKTESTYRLMNWPTELDSHNHGTFGWRTCHHQRGSGPFNWVLGEGLKDRDAKKLRREYSCAHERVTRRVHFFEILIIRFRRRTQRAITKGVVDAALRGQQPESLSLALIEFRWKESDNAEGWERAQEGVVRLRRFTTLSNASTC